MPRQKQNLLWLMITCCFTCQMTSADKPEVILRVNATDKCFLTNPDIKLTSDDDKNDIMIVELNLTAPLETCKTYSFHITTHGKNIEVRMNEKVEEKKINFSLDKRQCLKDPIKAGDDCLKSLAVDPGERCRNATYEGSRCKNKGSGYILYLKEQINGVKSYRWTCVICNKPAPSCQGNKNYCHKQPETNFSLPQIEEEGGFIHPSKASGALENLDFLVKEMELGKQHSAMISMGNVTGIIQIQADNTQTEDFCYSSDQKAVNILDCLSDLETGFPWSVMIPSEAFDKALLQNNTSAFVKVVRFTNIGSKNESKIYTVLNNEVYGISMGANISNLTNNIEMFFTQNDWVNKSSCVSWDGEGELKWTTLGCETEQIDNDTIMCSCSHLTFFAVLMIPQSKSNENETAQHQESLTYITSIGCGISMFFLSIALFMHFLLRKAKSNQATKILMNMFVALFLLNASFLSNESVANTQDNAACVFIALLLHYSMLATFTWFFIQALHMYLWLIRQNVTITNYMRKITVLGWVCPAPIVIAIASVGEYKPVIINTTSDKTSRMCWITSLYIHYIVNIGYYSLVFIFTTGIFITIITKVIQARLIRATEGKRMTFRKQLMMVLSLFLLFGLTWSVAFFSYGALLIPSYYIFTVLNSFQGFFLFLYYYHIHNDVAGRFSDDPKSSGSTTTMVPPNTNGLQNVYN